MPSVRPLGWSHCGLVSLRAAAMCVAALGILWARAVPPDFPPGSINSTISSQVTHGHRPCFDHEDAQWATPPATALSVPPPLLSAGPIHAAERFVELTNNGWHYNRPPPIS